MLWPFAGYGQNKMSDDPIPQPVYSRETVDPRISFAEDFRISPECTWKVVGASVPGRSKFAQRRRCEDYASYFEIASGCGVLVVADGAGSAARSDVGAEFVAKIALPRALRAAAVGAGESARSALTPLLVAMPEAAWATLARQAIRETYSALCKLARRLKVDVEELSSTAIACAILPGRLLVVHVGDGRGAYHTREGGWAPLFEPIIGENAGETVFVASPIYDLPGYPEYIRCSVHDVNADAVCIMSDGCEKATFILHTLDEQTGKYKRSNLPFTGFFDELPPYLDRLSEAGKNIPGAWGAFLTDGTNKLAQEQDDKSMIVAYLPGWRSAT
jgi:hypothetical protein